MWLWAEFFGLDNISLRLPSLIASLAAPLLILWQGPRERTTRLLWSGTAASLIPLAIYSTEARSYALLFFLATAQAILMLNLLRNPVLRLALGWAAVSTLLMLTHYYAVFLVAAQALGLLACLRLHTLRLWPAVLVFAPFVSWLLYHIPFILTISKPGMAWQQLLEFRVATLERVSNDLLGMGVVSMPLLIGSFLIIFCGMVRHRWGCPDGSNLVVATASLLAALLIVILGMATPSYHARYLLPVIPGILLAVAVVAQRLEARLPWLPAMVLLLFAMSAGGLVQRNLALPARNLAGQWEHASSFMMAQKVTRFAFAYDDPLTSAAPVDLLARVGGFFFHRAEYPVRIAVLNPDTNRVRVNANEAFPALLASMPGNGRGGFIWVYSRATARPTMAKQHSPDATLKARFACSNHAPSYAETVVLVCVEHSELSTRGARQS
jgi:hypothetical protein